MRWFAAIALCLTVRTALACPTLPEGTDWWTEEIAPECGAHPFRDALALLDAPNICDGPCPRVCRMKRSDDHVSTVTYDAAGRWTQTAPLLNGYAGSRESCTYDGEGHRDRCTRFYTPTIRSSPTIVRDRAGHVVKITDEETTRFTYDRRGRLTEAVTSSERWTYRYDARGRITREERLTRSPRRTTITTYRYNRAGQLVERASPDTRIVYAYAGGRLVEQTSTVGMRRLGGPETYVVRFSYDAQGRPLTAGGITFEYCDR